MSHSISKSIIATFKHVATDIDNIISYLNNNFHKDDLEYSLEASGHLSFRDSGTDYRFNDISDFKDALSGENLDEIYIWNVSIRITSKKKGAETYTQQDVVNLGLSGDMSTRGNYYGTRLEVDELDYSNARTLMDNITAVLKSSYFVRKIIDTHEEDRAALAKKAYDILNNLTPLQARIIKPFEDEKDFQRFLFPILKSHFPTLQEEDFLPKLAGKASKPDFGIIDMGIAFEIKFNKENNLLEIRKEILIDSREYFGKASPYKLMIVAIYNSSGQPIPVNYIEDLQELDVIFGVAISPPVNPAEKIR